MGTKIEWCDEVWNPVWGCHNNCPYCYAKSIAKRFGKTQDEKDFIPHWKESNFNKRFARSVKRVFVNSMSDIIYWDIEWMVKVIERIKIMPNIQFIFLTKGGVDAYGAHCYPKNCVLGFTAERQDDIPTVFAHGVPLLLNIEPILEPFTARYPRDIRQFDAFDWIIIGAETGNRKGKPIPELSWYESLISDKTFIKPSLRDITPDALYVQNHISNENSAVDVLGMGK